MNQNTNETANFVTAKLAWHTPTVTILDIDATASGTVFHGPESTFTHPS